MPHPDKRHSFTEAANILRSASGKNKSVAQAIDHEWLIWCLLTVSVPANALRDLPLTLRLTSALAATLRSGTQRSIFLKPCFPAD